MKPDYSQRTILVLKGGSEFVIFKYFEYCNEHIQNLQFKSRAQDNDPLFVHRILLVLELYGPIETCLIRWTFMGEKPCLKNLKILKMLSKVLRCHFWLKTGNIVPGKGALARIPETLSGRTSSNDHHCRDHRFNTWIILPAHCLSA